MLGTEYIVVVVALRLAAGGSYLAATWRGTARPNPVSWLCWGATPLVAFVAQIQAGVTPAAWVTLSLGVGPLSVFVVSLGKRSAWRVGRADVLCGGCAALGIVLWQVADTPGPALALSIVADILGSIPTLAKIYHEPQSEKASPYLVSLLGMALTLLTLHGWKYLDYAFPLYMLLINLSIFGLIVTRSAQLRRATPSPTEPRPSNVTILPARPVPAGQRRPVSARRFLPHRTGRFRPRRWPFREPAQRDNEAPGVPPVERGRVTKLEGTSCTPIPGAEPVCGRVLQGKTVSGAGRAGRHGPVQIEPLLGRRVGIRHVVAGPGRRSSRTSSRGVAAPVDGADPAHPPSATSTAAARKAARKRTRRRNADEPPAEDLMPSDYRQRCGAGRMGNHRTSGSGGGAVSFRTRPTHAPRSTGAARS